MSAPRISARQAVAETSRAQFASDVESYLVRRPRQLPSRYFYDALGSALFEAICRLPWYSIGRAELRLIESHGRAILQHLAPLSTLVELGPGNGQKLGALLEAGRMGLEPLDLHLVDVSRAALSAAAHTLGAMADVHVVTHQAPYEVGLAEVTREKSQSGRTIALFLGSNIGNFDRPGAAALLLGIRAALVRGDGLLVGADLIKPERELVTGYDDPLGVTAAFNRNLLVRINRELGADFDLEAFTHRAVWNAAESRIEMHLVSQRRQRVRVKASGLEFALEEAEAIWTESSYKYGPGDITTMLGRAGLQLVEQWIDREDGFALTLVRAA